MNEVSGTFEIQMTPDAPEVDGSVVRFSFEKKWHGGLSGSSRGIMLSAGDPESGSAGYIVAEVFHGTLSGAFGGFHFLQLGVMHEGDTQLSYLVAPGSGNGELAGITGTLTLTVVSDEHRYVLSHNLDVAPEEDGEPDDGDVAPPTDG